MKKNLLLYIAIGIFALFTAVYFISVNKISYAFEYSTPEDLYDNKIKLIESVSLAYAKANPKLFKKESDVYITVDDLIKAKYLAGDEDGNIIDPLDEDKTLNDIKIRLTKDKNDEYSVKVLK